MSKEMTYPAYKIYSASEDEPVGVVWFDGKVLRASNESILHQIKQQVIDGMDYTSGKDFFEALPRIYKSGYVYVRKAEVDREGHLV